MNPRFKTAGVVLTLLAVACFIAWQFLWKQQRAAAVSARLFDRTREVVKDRPELQADWDAALKDDVLTMPEAKAILEKAGEKVEPGE